MNPPGKRASRLDWLAYEASLGLHASSEDYVRYVPLRAEVVAKLTRADAVRAMGAFNQVLSDWGHDAEEACTAQFELERWDDGGFDEDVAVDEVDLEAAAAWREACEAARVELCDKAPHVSASAFDIIEFFEPVPDATRPWAFSLPMAARNGAG